MKYFVAVLFAAFAVFGVQAQTASLFGGIAGVSSQGIAAAGTAGGSVATNSGVAGTVSGALAGQIGGASANVTPTGISVLQGGAAGGAGGSLSGASGNAAAGSIYGAGGANQSFAEGLFGTLGVTRGNVNPQ